MASEGARATKRPGLRAAVNVYYTLEGASHSVAVRLSEPADVRVFQLRPDDATGLFARVPLHLCLAAICDADPRLLPTATTDCIVKALQPAHTLRQVRALSASDSSHRMTAAKSPRTPGPAAPSPARLKAYPLLALLPSPTRPRPPNWTSTKQWPLTPPPPACDTHAPTRVHPRTPSGRSTPSSCTPPSKGIFDACGLLSVALEDTSSSAPRITALVRPAHGGETSDPDNSFELFEPESVGDLLSPAFNEVLQGANGEDNLTPTCSDGSECHSSSPAGQAFIRARQRAHQSCSSSPISLLHPQAEGSMPVSSCLDHSSARELPRSTSPTSTCRAAPHHWALDIVLRLEPSNLVVAAQRRRDIALGRARKKVCEKRASLTDGYLPPPRGSRGSRGSHGARRNTLALPTSDLDDDPSFIDTRSDDGTGEAASSIPSAPSLSSAPSPASTRSLSLHPAGLLDLNYSPNLPQDSSDPFNHIHPDHVDPTRTLGATQVGSASHSSFPHPGPSGPTDAPSAPPAAAAQLLAHLDQLQHTSSGGQALAGLAKLLSQALRPLGHEGQAGGTANESRALLAALAPVQWSGWPSAAAPKAQRGAVHCVHCGRNDPGVGGMWHKVQLPPPQIPLPTDELDNQLEAELKTYMARFPAHLWPQFSGARCDPPSDGDAELPTYTACHRCGLAYKAWTEAGRPAPAPAAPFPTAPSMTNRPELRSSSPYVSNSRRGKKRARPSIASSPPQPIRRPKRARPTSSLAGGLGIAPHTDGRGVATSPIRPVQGISPRRSPRRRPGGTRTRVNPYASQTDADLSRRKISAKHSPASRLLDDEPGEMTLTRGPRSARTPTRTAQITRNYEQGTQGAQQESIHVGPCRGSAGRVPHSTPLGCSPSAPRASQSNAIGSPSLPSYPARSLEADWLVSSPGTLLSSMLNLPAGSPSAAVQSTQTTPQAPTEATAPTGGGVSALDPSSDSHPRPLSVCVEGASSTNSFPVKETFAESMYSALTPTSGSNVPLSQPVPTSSLPFDLTDNWGFSAAYGFPHLNSGDSNFPGAPGKGQGDQDQSRSVTPIQAFPTWDFTTQLAQFTAQESKDVTAGVLPSTSAGISTAPLFLPFPTNSMDKQDNLNAELSSWLASSTAGTNSIRTPKENAATPPTPGLSEPTSIHPKKVTKDKRAKPTRRSRRTSPSLARKNKAKQCKRASKSPALKAFSPHQSAVPADTEVNASLISMLTNATMQNLILNWAEGHA